MNVLWGAIVAVVAAAIVGGAWRGVRHLTRWVGAHLKRIIVEALDEHVEKTFADRLGSIDRHLADIELRLSVIEGRSRHVRLTDGVMPQRDEHDGAEPR